MAVARQAARAGGARAAGPADAGRRRGRSALVTNFAAQWLHLRNLDVDHAGHAPVPGLRRQPAAGVPPGDRAVLRERPARGPQRARSAAARTTRSSTSGWRSTTASRTSTAAASAASRSTTDSGRGGLLRQGSILTVTSYATRTSPVIRGKWILENLLGMPPPPPPPNVPALKDNTVRRQPLGPRAAGRASQQRGLRRLPQPDGSGRAVARELRRGRPLADASRTARPIDASGRPARRQQVRRRRRARSGAAAPAGAVRRHADREAADLRARAAASSTTTRPAIRAIVRDAPGAGLPLLVDHPRRSSRARRFR